MTDVAIDKMTTTIEFEPAGPAAMPQGVAGSRAEAADRMRLKELLRPVILEILGDELAMHARMRG